MKPFFFIIALLGLASCDDRNACPPSETIIPCSCLSGGGHGISVRCNDHYAGNGTVDEAKDILKALSNKRNIHLFLSNYNLEVMPSGIFDNLDIRRLVFTGGNINGFEGTPVFHGLEDSIKELGIYHAINGSIIDTFSLNFSHLRKLKKLVFVNNFGRSTSTYDRKTMTIGNDWFEGGPASLKTIDLYRNAITSFGSNVFSSLINLKELTASSNKISVIKRSMFPDPANNLVSITLNDNEIETLPEDLFSNMPLLEIVKLHVNRLGNLDQRTWEPVWEQLEFLSFSEYLECDSTMNWVFAMKRPRKLIAICRSGDPKKIGKHLSDIIDERV